MTLGVLKHICKSLTPKVYTNLQRQGYAVVDNCIDINHVNILRKEINQLKQRNALHLNSTRMVTQCGENNHLQKDKIWELDLFNDELLDCENLAALNSETCLIEHLSQNLFTSHNKIQTTQRLNLQTAKVQFNEGAGGCFPWHFDTDPLIDSRRITAILYLNHEWDVKHGGQLCLSPWPEPTIKIDPVGGRIVLFSSADIVHRVLPSSVSRYCLTLWFWANDKSSVKHQATFKENRENQGQISMYKQWRGANVCTQTLDMLQESIKSHTAEEADEVLRRKCPNKLGLDSEKYKIDKNDLFAALQILLQPQYRRHLIRWAIGEEWAQSIIESHGKGIATDKAVQQMYVLNEFLI
eukprot:GSMAST32.ASY1.ANO1.2373.1 assembled CDS